MWQDGRAKGGHCWGQNGEHQDTSRYQMHFKAEL